MHTEETGSSRCQSRGIHDREKLVPPGTAEWPQITASLVHSARMMEACHPCEDLSATPVGGQPGPGRHPARLSRWPALPVKVQRGCLGWAASVSSLAVQKGSGRLHPVTFGKLWICTKRCFLETLFLLKNSRFTSGISFLRTLGMTKAFLPWFIRRMRKIFVAFTE